MKRLILATFLIFVLCFQVTSWCSVRAEEYALSMTVNCPSKVYAGESFFCQVTIYNDDNASHKYALLWVIDNPENMTPAFNTSGTIGPYETIETGQSFTFSGAEDPYLSSLFSYNAHQILITLLQDGYTVANEESDIHVVAVDVSLVPIIQPIPVLSNSSFSLNLIVVNEGGEVVNATVRVYEVRGVITLQSGPVADYGQISASSSQNQTFNFDVSPNASPGEYVIKVSVSYLDTRGDTYSRNYYVPIPVSSRTVQDELSLFESTTENAIDKLRSDLDLASRSLITFSALLLAVSVGLAAANYWYSRRTFRSRRKVAT